MLEKSEKALLVFPIALLAASVYLVFRVFSTPGTQVVESLTAGAIGGLALAMLYGFWRCW